MSNHSRSHATHLTGFVAAFAAVTVFSLCIMAVTVMHRWSGTEQELAEAVSRLGRSVSARVSANMERTAQSSIAERARYAAAVMAVELRHQSDLTDQPIMECGICAGTMHDDRAVRLCPFIVDTDTGAMYTLGQQCTPGLPLDCGSIRAPDLDLSQLARGPAVQVVVHQVPDGNGGQEQWYLALAPIPATDGEGGPMLAGLAMPVRDALQESRLTQAAADGMTAQVTAILAAASADVRRSVTASLAVIVLTTAFLLAVSGWIAVNNGRLLASSEQWHRGLIENSLVGMFVYQHGEFRFVNRRLAEMLGCEPDALIGGSLLDWVHPDYRDQVVQRMRMRLSGKEVPDSYELPVINAQGETRWADLWVRSLGNSPDQEVLVTAIDITERKRTEDALRRSEARFRTLFEGTSDAVILADGTRGFFDCNPATLAVFGCATREEFCSRHFGDLSPPHQPCGANSLALANQLIETAFDAGSHSFEWIHTRVHTGDVFPAEVVLTALELDGRMVVQAVVRDITVRKRTEDALRRSEIRFRTLFEGTSDAVMLLDRAGFFDCNPATLAIFGCATLDEFCSKHPSDLSPPHQPCGTDSLTLASQRIETAFGAGSHSFEWMHMRADTGEAFPAEVLLTALELDGQMVLQAVVRDITERKRAEHELMLSERKFRTFTEQARHPVWVVQDGRIVYCNSALAFYMGLDKAEDACGLPVRQITHSDDWPQMQSRLQLLDGDQSDAERVVVRLMPPGDQMRWHDVQFARIEYEGRPAVLADSQDITEIKMLMEQLNGERLRDSLTGLFNRRHFKERFLAPSATSERRRGDLTLLMLDVDGFKSVNDVFGHATGDRVLRAVAEVLREQLRDSDIAIRFGGDEFLVVMPSVSSAAAEAAAERIGDELVAHLQGLVEQEGLPEQLCSIVRLSGGAATCGSSGQESMEEALRIADERMYRHKQQNKWRLRDGYPGAIGRSRRIV